MRKMLVLFVLVLVGLPAMAEAQSRRPYGGSRYDRYRYEEMRDVIYGRYGRTTRRQVGYGGGYYDPAYLEQMFQLPESLVACQLNFETGRYTGCHTLLKSVEYMEGHAERHEDRNEILGTFHTYKKDGKTVRHFHAFDDTDRRIGKGTKIAIGTAAGAAGGAILAGGKGGVIGAGVGALAGWWAAHKTDNHDDCEEIAQPQPAETETTVDTGLTNSNESVPKSSAPLASITWPTVNTTDFRAVVTDPNSGQERLIPAGGSANLPEPTGEQPYAVVLLAPGRGSIDRVPGEIRPSEDFQGWDIVAR